MCKIALVNIELLFNNPRIATKSRHKLIKMKTNDDLIVRSVLVSSSLLPEKSTL